MLPSNQLHIPATVPAITLKKEFLAYEINISDRGHATFNARSGQHGDFVIALGLSVGLEPQAAKVQVVDYLNREPTLENWFSDRQRVRRLRGR